MAPHGLAPSPPTMAKQRRDQDRRPGTGDWQTHTNRLLDETKQHKQQSQLLRDQNIVVKKTGDRDVLDQQSVVNEELKRKVALTSQLKTKLEKQLAQTVQELALQVQERARTKEKLDARRRPMRVAEARQKQRLERPPVEQINDAVERTLRQETLELRASAEQLAELVKTSGELITRLEHSKRQLEADLVDKSRSLDLDRQCLEVRHDSAASGQAATMLAESRTLAQQKAPNAPERWKQSTVQRLAEAAELEQRSVRLRKTIQKAVQSLNQSNTQAKAQTDDAFRNKLKQTQTLHSQLQQHLRAVCDELDELQRNREQLQRTLISKEGPLNIIRQRLSIRQRRPEREAVRDSVESALQAELGKLQTTMHGLQEKLKDCDHNILSLQSLKRQLEVEVGNKASALAHDRRALQIDANQVRSDWSRSQRDAVSQCGGSQSARSVQSARCSLPSVRSAYTPRPAVGDM